MKNTLILRISLIILSLLLPTLGEGGPIMAQDGRTDVLRLNVYFQRGISRIDPEFRDNGAHMQSFREVLEARLREGCAGKEGSGKEKEEKGRRKGETFHLGGLVFGNRYLGRKERVMRVFSSPEP